MSLATFIENALVEADPQADEIVIWEGGPGRVRAVLEEVSDAAGKRWRAWFRSEGRCFVASSPSATTAFDRGLAGYVDLLNHPL